MTDRKFPIGSEIRERAVSFRVWAPKWSSVEVIIEPRPGENRDILSFHLEKEGEEGYFSGDVKDAREGSLYRFRLDGQEKLYPDPASRCQPYGPHGPSEVVDPDLFKWTDAAWRGIDTKGQVLYEMHIGTFTEEGTWQAALRELDELASLGISVIEHMPVAEFPGHFGWGYDGVNLFAPYHLYGSPDDFKSFINRAHEVGLGVVLDVVYNHMGPDGNFLPLFSESYFTNKYENEWGKSINFDGPGSGPVRELFLTNVRYWIDEYHLDGLRLDATQSIFDASDRSIIQEIAECAREAAGTRKVYIIAENEPQDAKMAMAPEEGGYGLNALWNDDFHHAAIVAMTGRREAYYTDYLGSPQEFISLLKYGFLYQGQYYTWQKKCRGVASLTLPPSAFILFIENHDQIANSCCGDRMKYQTDPGIFRAMTALMLLAPGTPMIFQGQEFAASSPFLYFVDLPHDLEELVRRGRLEFLAQFPSLTETDAPIMPDTGVSAFTRSKLDLNERKSHAQIYDLHKDLLKLRKDDPVFSMQKPGGMDGAVLAEHAFLLRYFGIGGDDRLVMVNLGPDTPLNPMPEPLLAPPVWGKWELMWSSEDNRYEGRGTRQIDFSKEFFIPSRCVLVFQPVNTTDTGDRHE